MPTKPTNTVQPGAWHVAPGYVLAREIKRDELQRLLPPKTKLEMPDNTGRASDAVTIARVVELGQPLHTFPELPEAEQPDFVLHTALQSGDLIAYMPLTDVIIPIDQKNHVLVEYRKIRGFLRPATPKENK